MAEKEGALVMKGHNEGMKLAIAVLEEFNLPNGILPLGLVIEVGFVRNTGYFWVIQENKLDHYFQTIGKTVSYDTEVNGYIKKKCIAKLQGVRAKEFMMWITVNGIIVDDQSDNGNTIMFKSYSGIYRTFPIEAFQIA